jgi:hypothetical protein
MWAMIPILRTLDRSVLISTAIRVPDLSASQRAIAG